jgi:hypothetical protein
LWLDGLRRQGKSRTRWLWHGYLAAGSVTLLTSQWKAGKTTLLSVLLDRMKAGGELAGLPVAASRAVVVSEEGPEHWLRRSERLDLAGHVCWLCRPFAGKPTMQQWQDLLARLAREGRSHQLDLAVIDPLAAFLPGRDENSAAGMLEALLPLGELTRQGMAVLVLHHPRKHRTEEGQSPRGSGALPSYADVLIEMGWYDRPSERDRKRVLRAWSRYEETPAQLVIELNAAGTDYRACGDCAQTTGAERWQALQALLEGAPLWGLTRQEILEGWPEGMTTPNPGALWRWLERLVRQGQVWKAGRGTKGMPYRYGLPGREATPLLPELPDLSPL